MWLRCVAVVGIVVNVADIAGAAALGGSAALVRGHAGVSQEAVGRKRRALVRRHPPSPDRPSLEEDFVETRESIDGVAPDGGDSREFGVAPHFHHRAGRGARHHRRPSFVESDSDTADFPWPSWPFGQHHAQAAGAQRGDDKWRDDTRRHNESEDHRRASVGAGGVWPTNVTDGFGHAVDLRVLLQGVPVKTFNAMRRIKASVLADVRKIITTHVAEWMTSADHIESSGSSGRFQVLVESGSFRSEDGMGRTRTTIHIRILLATHADGNHVLSNLNFYRAGLTKEITRRIDADSGSAVMDIRSGNEREVVEVSQQVRDMDGRADVSNDGPTGMSVVYRITGVDLRGDPTGHDCQHQKYETAVRTTVRGAMGAAGNISYDHTTAEGMVTTTATISFVSNRDLHVARRRLAAKRESLEARMAAAVAEGMSSCGAARPDASVVMEEPVVVSAFSAARPPHSLVVFHLENASRFVIDIGAGKNFTHHFGAEARRVTEKYLGHEASKAERTEVWSRWVRNDTVLETTVEVVTPTWKDAAFIGRTWRETSFDMADDIEHWARRALSLHLPMDGTPPTVFFAGAYTSPPAAPTRAQSLAALVIEVENVSWIDLTAHERLWALFNDAVVRATMHAAGLEGSQARARAESNRPGSYKAVQVRMQWPTGTGPEGRRKAEALKERLERHEAHICTAVSAAVRRAVQEDGDFVDIVLGHFHARFYGAPHAAVSGGPPHAQPDVPAPEPLVPPRPHHRCPDAAPGGGGRQAAEDAGGVDDAGGGVDDAGGGVDDAGVDAGIDAADSWREQGRSGNESDDGAGDGADEDDGGGGGGGALAQRAGPSYADAWPRERRGTEATGAAWPED